MWKAIIVEQSVVIIFFLITWTPSLSLPLSPFTSSCHICFLPSLSLSCFLSSPPQFHLSGYILNLPVTSLTSFSLLSFYPLFLPFWSSLTCFTFLPTILYTSQSLLFSCFSLLLLPQPRTNTWQLLFINQGGRCRLLSQRYSFQFISSPNAAT